MTKEEVDQIKLAVLSAAMVLNAVKHRARLSREERAECRWAAERLFNVEQLLDQRPTNPDDPELVEFRCPSDPDDSERTILRRPTLSPSPDRITCIRKGPHGLVATTMVDGRANVG